MTENFYKDGKPDGWYLRAHTGYKVGVDTVVNEKSGKHPVVVESIDDAAEYQPLTLSLKYNYVGKKITLSGYIKTENVSENGFVGLWMRIDPQIDFDNMHDREINGTSDWTRYEITLDLNPSKTTAIDFGAMIIGSGKVWFDDLKVTVDGKDLSEVESIDFYDNEQDIAEKSKVIQQKSLEQRTLLKADGFKDMGEYWDATDQCRDIDSPPVQKEYSGEIIKLPAVNTEMDCFVPRNDENADVNAEKDCFVPRNDENADVNAEKDCFVPRNDEKKTLYDCIQNRRSRRKFTDEKITLNELSFLLWSTQGVQRKLQEGRVTIRTVPSGGARHPFETYLAIFNVEGLEQGIYRYLPLEHALTFLFNQDDLKDMLIDAASGQNFAGETGVTFIWSAIPYRTEWRYGFASAKTILLDCGHVCQNLYLACEALNLGTCAIAAYDQQKIDELLKLDGEEELTIYLAPVGRIK